MRTRLTPSQIWKVPAVLGTLSAVGLTAALFSESLGDVAAWLALSIPVVTVIWYVRRSSALRALRTPRSSIGSTPRPSVR
jgi:hypothetical protein